MKNKIFLFALFLIIMPKIYCQNDKKSNIQEAISYINLFLNEENWVVKTTGELSYNNYSKTLSYKSKSIFDNESKTVSDFKFSFNLDNVLVIKENIHKADKNDINKSNIISYNIFLKNEVFKSLYIQKKNDIIPDYKNEKVKEVWFAIEKSTTDEDVENIKHAIRDVFQNIPIETEYF